MTDSKTRMILFQSTFRRSFRTPFCWSDFGISFTPFPCRACQSACIVPIKSYQKLPSWYQKGSVITGSAGYSDLSFFGFLGVLSALGALSTAFSGLVSAW